MIIHTEGIVFRSIKYGETSVIADIYTRARGLKTYIVSGVRKKRPTTNPNLLQVMSIVEMVVYDKEHRGICRIKELKSGFPYRQIPFSIYKSAVGQFMIETTRHAIRDPEAHHELYDFVRSMFCFLDECKRSIHNLHLYYLVQLSKHLGFCPEVTANEIGFFDMLEGKFVNQVPSHPHFMNSDISKIYQMLLRSELEMVHQIPIGNSERRETLDDMLQFYQLHIDHFGKINSHLVLNEVFK